MEKTKNPTKAPVKSLKTLVSDSSSSILIILMNWQSIVGKSNARIMMPLEIRQKTLEIALPNNIVLSAVSKFSATIIKKANLCLGNENVGKLKFVIEPAYFKKTKIEKKKTDLHPNEISKEEIIQKKQELITKFGLNENIAECAAEIELLNIKRG